jgi:predicted nucleic acid-binding Zn ribbon protein
VKARNNGDWQTMKEPARIGGAIGKLMQSLGLKRPYDGWQVVVNWPEIVGDEISSRAEAIRYENGTVFVVVPDDSWRQQLSLQTEMILEKIHSYPYGRAVKTLRLVKGKKGQ